MRRLGREERVCDGVREARLLMSVFIGNSATSGGNRFAVVLMGRNEVLARSAKNGRRYPDVGHYSELADMPPTPPPRIFVNVAS